jgi:predicted small lipoprotein YifL
MVPPHLGNFAVRSTTSPAPLRWAALVLFAVTLALAGCGRKGPLDLPPNSAAPPPVANTGTNAVAAEGDAAANKGSFFDPSSNGTDPAPAAGKGRKRPFVLDPLLGN